MIQLNASSDTVKVFHNCTIRDILPNLPRIHKVDIKTRYSLTLTPILWCDWNVSSRVSRSGRLFYQFGASEWSWVTLQMARVILQRDSAPSVIKCIVPDPHSDSHSTMHRRT